ncbi:MAG: PAS domain S-box protein [Polyangiales bacterium]
MPSRHSEHAGNDDGTQARGSRRTSGARESSFGSPQLERAARISFLTAFVLGLVVIAADAVDLGFGGSPWITRVRPDAAHGITLLGFALWLRRGRGRHAALRDVAGLVAITLALATAGLALLEAGRHLSRGVAHYLSATVSSSTMSPFTALSLLLLGLAGAVVNARGRRLVLTFASLPLLISLGSLVGYAYGSDPRHASHTLPPMVALSAVGVALLSIGVICTRLKPETGALLSGRDDAGMATRRLLLGLIAIPIVLGALELALRPLGVYEMELGTALLVVANVLLLVSLSLWHTHEAQRALRRQAQLERELAHKEAEIAADVRMRSERTRGQRALERSEEKFRTLAVHAPVAIFEATSEGGCTFVNRKWMELTERTLEESLGFGWTLAIHPDDRDRVANDWSVATDRGEPLHNEYRFLARSGKVSWVQGSAVPVRDAAGSIASYLGTLVDVTERKHTIDALAKSERSFRSLVDRAPFGVVVFRANEIAYANATYGQMLGYDDALEMVGMPLLELIAERARAEVSARVERLDRGEQPIAPTPVPCKRKDGSEVLLEGTSANIVFDGTDAVVAVARDVTEQQRVEHVRLLAERAVRESLREKEVLLKEIHHRVKNNLQVIVSLINLQASKIDDEVTRSAFSETRARVHAIALLHERLYRSKNLGRIDMRDYLHGLASDLSSTAQLRHVETRVVAEEVYWEMDSAVPIGLIVNELVTNAYKHAFPSEQKIGRIEIELTRRGEECTVTVSDDGVGFPDDFESHDSLGLLLITSLSRQLGGGVTFENRQGARAVVRFPDPSREGTRTGELRTA